MAKLPPKPRNIVHDYFPVGTDGQSPMNALDGSAWEAMKFKQGELDEDGKPIKSILNKNGDPDDPSVNFMQSMVDMDNENSKQPVDKANEKLSDAQRLRELMAKKKGGTSAFPDIQGCPKGMERNAKGECVAIKESPSYAKTVKDGKQYKPPTTKIETPVLAMQAGKAKRTPTDK